MEIKNRFTNEVILIIEGANLRSADLYGADLRSANLEGADLYGANLEGEILTKTPLIISNLKYWCLISDDYMRLGCKRFTHVEWSSFDDDTIAAMDSNALDFWRVWKGPLLAMCNTHAMKGD